MALRDQIENGLAEIGAGWAVSRDKYVAPEEQPGTRPAYHIHPDRTNPHQNAVRRFESLADLHSWIQACKRAEASDEPVTVVWTDKGWDIA